MSVIQGTTPKNVFTLPFEVSQITDVRIIYSQKDAVVFTKVMADCTLEGNTVTVALTQEDTFALESEEVVQIQLRVKRPDGNVQASVPVVTPVEKCLDTEVM